jgi:hypothetical protein
MSSVEELKQFGAGHARAQEIPPERVTEIFARIDNDGDGPGSWVAEWSAAAAAIAESGEPLTASRYYNLARLPYVDGPARQAAQDHSVEAFGVWAAGQGITRLDVPVGDAVVRCWAAGLDAPQPRPVLIATGGIVSSKEQWAPLLAQAGRLGMAGVVAEMPGVGENTMRYDAESWRMFPAILDAIGDRADTARSFAMALSFSGHLALRAAVSDERLRGIATIGAPIHALFTDAAWQSRLPGITVDTLARLSRLERADLFALLPSLALDRSELSKVDIPVCYVASKRDEIIPAADVAMARAELRGLRLLQFDDVHGSPDHADETRMWIVHSILRMAGAPALQRAVVGGARTLIRVKRLLGAKA